MLLYCLKIGFSVARRNKSCHRMMKVSVLMDKEMRLRGRRTGDGGYILVTVMEQMVVIMWGSCRWWFVFFTRLHVSHVLWLLIAFVISSHFSSHVWMMLYGDMFSLAQWFCVLIEECRLSISVLSLTVLPSRSSVFLQVCQHLYVFVLLLLFCFLSLNIYIYMCVYMYVHTHMYVYIYV